MTEAQRRKEPGIIIIIISRATGSDGSTGSDLHQNPLPVPGRVAYLHQNRNRLLLVLQTEEEEAASWNLQQGAHRAHLTPHWHPLTFDPETERGQRQRGWLEPEPEPAEPPAADDEEEVNR